MLKKLSAGAALIVAVALVITCINSRQHTAVFPACPNTDYCSELGQTQQGDIVKIRYSGWPFKVKIGNPDYCTRGVCEGNKYHTSYSWEFQLYNVLLLTLPLVIVATWLLSRADPKLASRIGVILAATSVILLLGWYATYATRIVAIWDSKSEGDSTVVIKGGLPFPQTLSIASSCSLNDSTGKICARKALSYDMSVWHAPLVVYINWLFWSAIWALIVGWGGRKYAHTRH